MYVSSCSHDLLRKLRGVSKLQHSVCELSIPAYSFVDTPVKNFKKPGFGHLSIEPVGRTIVIAAEVLVNGMTSQNAAQIHFVGTICQHGFLSVQRPGQVKNHQRMQLREADLEVKVTVGRHERGFILGGNIQQLNRDDPDDIRVAASVKQVAANPVDKALEKIEVNSNYAGTVTLTDSTGIFVRLDMGAECRCRFPYRARPPKGARVVVKIAGVDMEQKTVWGNITYVTIPK